MTRPTPLPWVKSWTSSMSDPDWLMLPIEERGLFMELVKLAAIAYPRAVVRGSDEGIAAVLRVDPAVVTRSIDRLCAKPHKSLKRFAGGVKIVNWDKYQAADRFLSHDQRGAPVAITTQTRGESKSRERVEKEQTARRHPLLEGYDAWVDQPRDAARLDALAKQYPMLNLADELADWMAYADRRAGEGNAFVDYIAAFSNRLKSQFEYHKKRGWIEADRFDLPDLSREPARVG